MQTIEATIQRYKLPSNSAKPSDTTSESESKLSQLHIDIQSHPPERFPDLNELLLRTELILSHILNS